MVTISTTSLYFLTAMTIVCILSMLGSLKDWLNSPYSPEMIDNCHRWKWMVVVFMIIFIILLVGFTPNVS